MIRLLLATALVLSSFVHSARAEEVAQSPAVESSVVKIFSTVRHPDFAKPWAKHDASEATGSGVVIEGKRILTNAHVIRWASQVQVQPNQSADKISAKLVAMAPGIDLAVLELDDEAFFDTHPPLPRAQVLPSIKDTVLVYGYPQGGNTLSITKGIISRIEFTAYNFPVAGLRVQIDAAINPGNSGGPAVVGDTMVGLAFSHLGGADNIGYIIPCEEIELFLKDIADGHYDGKPAIFDELQTLENPALVPFLELAKGVQGILVRRPDQTNADYPLKQWDLITRIGDTPIDNQGMVKLGPDLRVHFGYLVQNISTHGVVPLTVVRAGKEREIQLPVTSKRALAIPNLDGAYPSYFVWGPLVFSTATREMLGHLTESGDTGLRWMQWLYSRGSPLTKRINEKAAFEGESLVVVSSPLLPHKLSNGYSNPIAQVVQSIDGRHVENLLHLVAILRDSKREFVVIEFEDRYAETLVFPRAQTLAATEDILDDNDIRRQGSPDTLEVWNSKKAR